MIYLFCSASRPLYKRDALECTCYPPGYLFRFRYEKRYVDPNIWESPSTLSEMEGVIVFLDTVGEEGRKDFEFFPIRRIKASRLFTQGLAIYIDFKFGEFIDYGSEENSEEKKAWEAYFRGLANRPWPSPEKTGRSKDISEGYFLLADESEGCNFKTESVIPHESWERLIRRLNKTEDLKDCTFFQILGLFHVKRSRWTQKSFEESPIPLRDNSYYSFYSLPAGKAIMLKLLLSRPGYKDEKDSRRKLSISFSPEAFVGVSKREVFSESRYNEERVLFVCKRLYDPILSAVSIEQLDEPASIQAAKPFLLTKIEVARSIVTAIIVGSIFGVALIGLDADSVGTVGTWISRYSFWGSFISGNAKALSVLGKMISGVVVSLCAYWAFRKLPIK
jgi:hypothetical protein